MKFQKYAIIFLIVLVSCSQKSIIPEKDMVAIIVRIQLINATIQHHNFQNSIYNKDTIDFYSKTVQSFGYTKAQFDSTLKMYTKDPKELDAIYDKVIIELSKIETGISTQKMNIEHSIAKDTLKNLWPYQSQYRVPEDGSVNSIGFEIPILGDGLYTISADIIVFPDDGSVKPTLTGYFYFDDKTPKGNISGLKTTEEFKDGIMRNYTIKLELNNSLVTLLKGNILDHNNPDPNFTKHASVSNIKVYFKPSNPIKSRPIKEDFLQH